MASPIEIGEIQTARSSMEARGFLPPQRLAITIYSIMWEHEIGKPPTDIDFDNGVKLRRYNWLHGRKTGVYWGDGEVMEVEVTQLKHGRELNIYKIGRGENGEVTNQIQMIDLTTGEAVLSVLETAVTEHKVKSPLKLPKLHPNQNLEI